MPGLSDVRVFKMLKRRAFILAKDGPIPPLVRNSSSNTLYLECDQNLTKTFFEETLMKKKSPAKGGGFFGKGVQFEKNSLYIQR